MHSLRTLAIIIAFAPLVGAIVAGMLGKYIGKRGIYSITISLVGIACFLSLYVLYGFITGDFATLNTTIYTWGQAGNVTFKIGFLLDELTALMLAMVSFISLIIHVYSVGYMQQDPTKQRFFSYISLFTFAMFMLVLANNFLQLFFGWEAVGFVSYLLIGFWFTREIAIGASLKAFLVNRVSDVGLLLGIAAILYYYGSIDYSEVFQQTAQLAATQTIQIFPHVTCSAITMICLCLLIGAIGKSAQIPLHIWLPDAMEAPISVSALIHAATMVTAGVFMIARMSPLFEHAEIVLSCILIIGAITCFFMGLVGIVQNDIKRIMAYSTLSQLGYMFMALGVSAYNVGIFHLITHAFFKALLFLGIGSVVISMRYQQDIQKLGALRKYMPVTYITMLIGSLALVGFPGFAGFFSKDLIIKAIQLATIPGAKFAYYLAVISIFVTALYTFRMFFLIFHGKKCRGLNEGEEEPQETSTIILSSLVLLAILSLFVGWLGIKLLLSGFIEQVVPTKHNMLLELSREFTSIGAMVLHGTTNLSFWLVISGAIVAWLFYVEFPKLIKLGKQVFEPWYMLLMKKYGFDYFYQAFFITGTKAIGRACWRLVDKIFIDGIVVNGMVHGIAALSVSLRKLQTGYLYHYAFAFIIGLVFLLLFILI